MVSWYYQLQPLVHDKDGESKDQLEIQIVRLVALDS